MRKTKVKKDRKATKACGSRKGKGGCSWGGATKGISTVKVIA
jgi:hypothetical protein